MASRYGLVKQRRSRFSYGILTYYPYDRKIDGDREVARPVWDKFDKKEMNVKVVEWLFRKVCIIHCLALHSYSKIEVPDAHS